MTSTKLSPKMQEALAFYALTRDERMSITASWPNTNTTAALVVRGLITPAYRTSEHELTDAGRVAYAELSGPIDWDAVDALITRIAERASQKFATNRDGVVGYFDGMIMPEEDHDTAVTAWRLGLVTSAASMPNYPQTAWLGWYLTETGMRHAQDLAHESALIADVARAELKRIDETPNGQARRQYVAWASAWEGSTGVEFFGPEYREHERAAIDADHYAALSMNDTKDRHAQMSACFARHDAAGCCSAHGNLHYLDGSYGELANCDHAAALEFNAGYDASAQLIAWFERHEGGDWRPFAELVERDHAEALEFDAELAESLPRRPRGASLMPAFISASTANEPLWIVGGCEDATLLPEPYRAEIAFGGCGCPDARIRVTGAYSYAMLCDADYASLVYAGC